VIALRHRCVCPIGCPIGSRSKTRTTWTSAASTATRARSAVHLCTPFTFSAGLHIFPFRPAEPRPRGPLGWPRGGLGARRLVTTPDSLILALALTSRLCQTLNSVTSFLFITGAEPIPSGGRT
jgi:hypothetical protein